MKIKLKSISILELVVVVLILSTLLVFSPNFFDVKNLNNKQRDNFRIYQIERLNQILKGLLIENPKINIGSSSVLYLSLPMKTATTNCKAEYPSLPDLPSGWIYHCAPQSSFTNTDGGGWLPVNLTQSVIQLDKLPTDPINDEKYFFAYTADNSKKLYEFLVIPESEANKGPNSISSKDEGSSIYLYEVGNDKNLVPEEVEIAIGVPSGEIIWVMNKNLDLYWDEISDVALDSDYIYIAGDHKQSESPSKWEWILAKVKKKDGTIENFISIDPTNLNTYDFDNIFGGLIVDDNYIYISGRAGSSGGTYLRMEKREKNTLNLVTVTTSGNFETPFNMEADANYLYISGWNRRTVCTSVGCTSDYYWVFEKRRKSDLGLEKVVTVNYSVPYAICTSSIYCLCFEGDYMPRISLSDSYLFIGGQQGTYRHGTTSCGTLFGRLEKRDKNLNLISFATISDPVSNIYTDGEKLYISTSKGLEKRNFNLFLENFIESIEGEIKSFGNYLYVGSSKIFGNNYGWVIHKIKKDDLFLIWTKTENISDRDDYIQDLEVDTSGLYVGGLDGNTSGGSSDTQLRLEKRNK